MSVELNRGIHAWEAPEKDIPGKYEDFVARFNAAFESYSILFKHRFESINAGTQEIFKAALFAEDLLSNNEPFKRTIQAEPTMRRKSEGIAVSMSAVMKEAGIPMQLAEAQIRQSERDPHPIRHTILTADNESVIVDPTTLLLESDSISPSGLFTKDAIQPHHNGPVHAGVSYIGLDFMMRNYLIRK